MSPEPIPACPKCHSKGRVHPDGEHNWTCLFCKWTFNDDPDEDRRHSNDPTRRIEREESRAERPPFGNSLRRFHRDPR
jgi:ribosomal protein L37AE/L43A